MVIKLGCVKTSTSFLLHHFQPKLILNQCVYICYFDTEDPPASSQSVIQVGIISALTFLHDYLIFSVP